MEHAEERLREAMKAGGETQRDGERERERPGRERERDGENAKTAAENQNSFRTVLGSIAFVCLVCSPFVLLYLIDYSFSYVGSCCSSIGAQMRGVKVCLVSFGHHSHC